MKISKYHPVTLYICSISIIFLTLSQLITPQGMTLGEKTTNMKRITTNTITPTNLSSVSPTGTPAVTITGTPSASPSLTPTGKPTDTSASIPVSLQTIIQSGNPLAGAALFNNLDTNSAARQIQEWQSSRPTDADMLRKIADQPKAIWLGNWNSNIQGDTQSIMNKALQANTVPVFIAYNIPGRDCGNYSAGGASSAQAYKDWINGLASGIGGNRAAVILEPDALAQDCLQGTQKQERYELLKYAVQKLKSLGKTAVYIDAGHSSWIHSEEMSQRLKNAGIEAADGFALNISNFEVNDALISYGQHISSQVNGKHFVVDTSRNGNGPADDKAWCNPKGRALGEKPTTITNNPLVDAYMWLKYPGQSDGSCNGAPAAGEWYPEYALELAKNAKW